MEINQKSFFQKISKNLTCYLISFISYQELKELMLINNNFIEIIRYYIKYEIDKNKKLFQFYKKHIFLFNNNCSHIQRVILPYVKDVKGLKRLLEKKSVIIKTFLADVDTIILNDPYIYNGNQYDKLFFDALRNDLLTYLAKIIEHNLGLTNVKELYLNGLDIGSEGAELIALIVKHYKGLSYLDISRSKLCETDIRLLLDAMASVDNFFSINLEGIALNLPLLKLISNIKNNDFTKEIYIDRNSKDALNISKQTRPKHANLNKFKKLYFK
jgi:hypothetical protein